MATVPTVVDDLDGASPAATVTLTVRTKDREDVYEVDLTDDHTRDLYGLLEPYMVNGRRVSGTGTPPPTIRRRKVLKLDRDTQEMIRAWAKEAGHRVAERGRLPGSVIDAYRAAHPDAKIPAA